jgi:predicted permease
MRHGSPERSRLYRAALRVVPRRWRDAISDDLEHEGQDVGRGPSWYARQAVISGLRLRALSLGDALWTELRYSLRRLRQSKLFTATAIVTFALGAGVNVAVFAAIDRMMFRPLPYVDAERLVHIYQHVVTGNPPAAMLDGPIGVALHQESATLGPLAQVAGRPSEQGANVFIPGRGFGDLTAGVVTASANVLEVLGVRPVVGSGVSPDEEPRTSVLLEHLTWRMRFGGSPDVVGREYGTYRVAGVLPEGFVLPTSQHDGAWAAMRLVPNTFERAPSRWGRTLSAVARLEPDVNLAAARAEVEAIASRVWREAGRPGVPGIRVEPIGRGMFAPYRAYLWLVVSGVVLVLLLTCANLSTMLLARWSRYREELAIRLALGASRGRLAVAPLLDAALICCAGGLAALLAFRLVGDGVLSSVPSTIRHLAVSSWDARLLGMACAVSVVATILAALLPARMARGWRMTASVPSRRGRTPASSLAAGRTLLAVEAALGVLLVAGALATSRNLVGLVTATGFEPAALYDLATAHGGWDDERVEQGLRTRAVLDAVRGTPGVAAAGLSVLTGSRIPGDACSSDVGEVHAVSPDSFRAMGTPFRAGRGVSPEEDVLGLPVVVINEHAARRAWPDSEPVEVVGRELPTTCGTVAVVGVVADIRRHPGQPLGPEVYMPASSLPRTDALANLRIAMRMAPGAVPDLAALRARLEAGFPPAYFEVASIAAGRAPALERPRFQAVLFGSVAAIALLLAAVGLFALTTSDAVQRRHETGVRMAMGATGTDIRRAVIGGALRPILLGTAAGVVVTWWAAQYLQSFLFEVDARDPWTYTLVALVLVATAVVAAWLPARRASRTDPASVLRAV